MTERDQWSERLRCPDCEVIGSVVLSQANPGSPAYHAGQDQNVRAEAVGAGFRTVVTDLGCPFHCAHCGGLAEHLRAAND